MIKSLEVRKISKVYKLGQFNSGTLREDLSHLATKLGLKKSLALPSINSREDVDNGNKYVYALKDIDIDICQGEVVGIIGRNGAGKSTLLKILSRITSPSSGEITIQGRLSSLLEIGTGFHPDLTGRENIYLNGALLGMSQYQINRLFNDILEFSGVKKYVDTPVKRYSSGMLVRLGFAVAAHLETDILIVDEVLAVGDAEFQEKCFGKIGEFRAKGKTVIFVSHNMGTVQSICPRSIVIERGHKVYDGETQNAIDYYNNILNSNLTSKFESRKDYKGSGCIQILDARVMEVNGMAENVVRCGSTVIFQFKLRVNNPETLNTNLVLRFTIVDHLQNNVAFSSNLITGEQVKVTSKEFVVQCKVHNFPIMMGVYHISAFIGQEFDPYQYFDRLLKFEVGSGTFYSTGRLPVIGHSTTLMHYEWNIT